MRVRERQLRDDGDGEEGRGGERETVDEKNGRWTPIIARPHNMPAGQNTANCGKKFEDRCTVGWGDPGRFLVSPEQ